MHQLAPNNWSCSEQMVLAELLYQFSNETQEDVYEMGYLGDPSRTIYGALLNKQERIYKTGSAAQGTHKALEKFLKLKFVQCIDKPKGIWQLTEDGLNEAIYLYL